MEYDDNDFQSNHFQLGGEDNSNSPSGLPSFSLTKFDLDEQLQVHLRFDSSVIPEDLLGFRGQEGSNWIDDFSSGSCAMEFSSGDSCSISRRNNVWSEATSSESVEMLLKSVGEDDMINNKIITDPGPHSVSHDTKDHVTSCLQKDNSNVDDAVKAEFTPAPDEDNNCFSGTRKNKTNVPSHDQDVYQASGEKHTGLNESPNLDVCSVEIGKIAVDECHFTENKTSSVKFLENDMVKVPFAFDESYHNGAQVGCPLDHDFLTDSAIDDHVASSLTNETSNLDLSNHAQVAFDSLSPTSIMDAVVSSARSSQQSGNDFADGKVSDTSMEGPREESQALHLGKETDCCQPEFSLLMGGFEESDFPKKSDGLLEVIIDQMEISKKENGIGGKVLSPSKESSFKTMEAVYSLEAHPIEKISETSCEVPGNMQETVASTENTEGLDGVDSQEKSNESDHGCGGRELVDSVTLMIEKQDIGNCHLDMKDGNNDEKDLSGLVEKVPCAINRMDVLQIADVSGLENLESHHELVDMGRNAGPELTTDGRSSEEIMSESLELNLKNVQNSQSNEDTCAEICHAGGTGAIDILTYFSGSLVPVEVPCPADSGSVVPVHDGCITVDKRPDTSLQMHDTSSASVYLGSPKKLVVEGESGTGIILVSKVLPSSDGSDEADQARGETPAAEVECREMTVSTLSVPVSTSLDRCGSEFFQSSKESCLPVMESGGSSYLDFLPLPFSKSECTITPVKLQHVPVEKRSMEDPVQSGHSNELHCSVGSNLTTMCIDAKVACIAFSEVDKKSEFDKLHNTSEKHDMEESSIPVDEVHSMDNSPQPVNSFECTAESPLLGPGASTCADDLKHGSPTVISSEHSHDGMDSQENVKGSSDKVEPISSGLLGTSDMEMDVGQGNIACETTEECNTSEEDKNFTFAVEQPAQHDHECGSPAVIGSEHSHDETDNQVSVNGSSDKIDPISINLLGNSDMEKNAGQGNIACETTEECDTSKEDKNFTFSVGQPARHDYKCGSPTVIGSELSHDEIDNQESVKGSKDKIDPILSDLLGNSDLERNADQVNIACETTEECNTGEEDKNFTFTVGQPPRHDHECGSPTVIGCEHAHDEIDNQESVEVSSDKIDPISSDMLGTSDMERNVGQGNIACETTEECNTRKEDKKFAFTGGQPALHDHECGSPTVIGCEHSHDEIDNQESVEGSSDKIDPISSDLLGTPDTERNVGQGNIACETTEECNTSKEDKNFAFTVGQPAQHDHECGSPTVIGNEHPQDEIDNQESVRGSSDKIDPISSNLLGTSAMESNAGQGNNPLETTEECDISKEDKNFTVTAGQPARHDHECGTPTVISSKHSHDEIDNQESVEGSSDKIDPISSNLLGTSAMESNAGQDNIACETTEECDTNEEDKNFTVTVGQPARHDHECGSPTVISSKHSHDEIDNQESFEGSSDKIDPISSNLLGTSAMESNAVQDNIACETTEECDTSEEDKNFTVTVGQPARHDHECGSPTVISSKRSHDEIDNQESVDGSSDKIDPISSNLLGTSAMESNAGQDNIACETTEECDTTEEDKNFTFTVGQPAQQPEKAVDGWKFVSDNQIVKCAPDTTIAGLHQSESNALRGASQGSQMLFSDGKVHDVVMKGIGKEKRRSVTASASSSKRRAARESQISKKTTEKSGISCNPSPNSVRIVTRDADSNEIQQCSIVERSSNKPPSSITAQSSSLPDLNTAASPASLINRPVTDAQQVQLRAQIFVYGSIIQGVPPDEACMVSAFGDADGGRIMWEGVLRAVAEKYHNQKSPLCKTPASLPVFRSMDQASACSPLQSKASSTLSCRTGNRSPRSTNFSTSMALPSPVWSMSTRDVLHSSISRGSHLDPTRIISPLHAYHTPLGGKYACNVSSGLAEPPCPVSLVPSVCTSALHTSTMVSSENGAKVQLQQDRVVSVPLATTLQFVTPTMLPATGVPPSASVTPPLLIDAMSPTPTKLTSSDQKSRKRKKGAGPEANKHISLDFQPLQDPVSHGVPPKAVISADSSVRADGGVTSSASPIISPTHFQIVSTGCSEHKVIFSEETCTKIEQAKLHAEDAAAFAVAAVRHSEGIWSQLANQRNSVLDVEVEQKLVCAAAAAAAAASVAKAAAAAAKVAADSALQAKLVADEAVTSSRTGSTRQGLETGHQYGEARFGKVGSTSTLKSNELTNNSRSTISAANEGSQKRVEDASAAAKRAENLDAIIKAAELAAGAMSQAGAIVTLGDPLPFSLAAILDAGPEDYWKPQLSQAEQQVKVDGIVGEQSAEDNSDGLSQPRRGFNQFPLCGENILQTVAEENTDPLKTISGQSVEKCGGNVSGITSGKIPDNENPREFLADDGNDSNIQEGSFVEVSSGDKGLEGVWYSARVVSLKDGQAYVCYNTLLSDDGSGKMKAWIPLKGETEGAPRIRIAHPFTTVNSEGTKKRRREVVGNYVWDVGDRVDAWIRDGWWEGIIMEKSIEDETKLTIHISAGGDLSVVRSWDLRPSLVWKDGEWMEWSHLKENKLLTNEGDTPREKRQKLTKPGDKNHAETEILGAPKACRHNISETMRKPDEHVPLALSAKEKIFSVGLVSGDDNNSERIKKAGLQKEGSRVVYGVPKQRKFMDVSKHCVVDNSEKGKAGSDSMKFAKYLMPQPQSSRGWKTVPKVDPRGKRAAEQKPKVLKSVKSQTVQTRSNVKEISSTSNCSASGGGGNARGVVTSQKTFASRANKKIEKKNLMEVGVSSNSGEIAGHALVSHPHPVLGFPSGNNSSSAAVGGRTERGKQTHTTEKPGRNDDNDSSVAVNLAKMNSGSSEPRRSNRRIQPTSRLLEGLQSSLMISKIPSISHDKGTKAAHIGAVTPRGRPRG